MNTELLQRILNRTSKGKHCLSLSVTYKFGINETVYDITLHGRQMLLAYIQIITWIQHRKLKAGVSNDTDIGKFIKNDMFDDSFNELELRAWK